MLDFIELSSTSPATHSVIWLHGLGADGNDFASLVPELKLPTTSAIRFIFPHAPVKSITINNGMKMRAWYDILALDRQMREDELGIRQSADAIAQLIEHEHARGIAYENIFLAGFSQGGAMALYTALRFPQKLAGIIALSCYLPLAKNLASEASVANKTIPIFLAHGNFDMVVPLMLAQYSKEALLQNHYTVAWHMYPMDHTVCFEEIKDIREWLLSQCNM